VSTEAVSAAPKELPPANVDPLGVPIAEISIGKNHRSPDPELLKELISSIKEVGVLEPVLLARRGRELELVAGFRRVAAAKKAGLIEIPARVLDVAPEEVVEIQLTENLQREGLTELEEARAFKEYVEAGHTQKELADRIGKSQPYVANRIRLLELPAPVVSSLAEGKLSPSHAEVMLQLPKEATPTEVDELLRRAVHDEESVKQLADRVRWKSGTIRDRVKRKKAYAAAVASSKFPTCPVKGCGGKGQPDIGWDGKVGPTFSDRSGHAWSRKSGELIKSRPRTETRQPAEPPKPVLPLVNGNVPCPLTPDELWQTFYADSTLGVTRFLVSTRGSKIKVDLSVESGRSHPNQLPSFELGRKPGFVEMRGCSEWEQRTDADRKRAAAQRQVLERWLAGLAKKAGKKKAK
jgi:ParB family transcriptional regulator, chromosome partitioning protein